MLDGLDLCIGSEGQGFNRRIRKGRAAYEGHACGDGDGLQCGVIERLGLNGLQGIGQNDTLHGTVHERVTADVDDVAAKVESSQVNIRCRSGIFDDCDIATRQLGILPVAVGDHVGNAQVVALGTVIPILGQVGGQGLSGKVDVYILGTQEGETTDEVHGGRNCDLG